MHEDNIIGQHNRCFDRYQRIYNPWHYVPALERKPGALRNGAPFKDLMIRPFNNEVQLIVVLIQVRWNFCLYS
jgi:hypothetical protein